SRRRISTVTSRPRKPSGRFQATGCCRREKGRGDAMNPMTSPFKAIVSKTGFKIKMQCAQAQPLLSAYLDGAVSGAEMQSLRAHLDSCAACSREYKSLRPTQQSLMSAGRPPMPADLGLKLRLAISREAAQSRRPYEGLRTRFE